MPSVCTSGVTCPFGSPCELLPALVTHTVTLMCKRHCNLRRFTGKDPTECGLLPPPAGQPGTCAFEEEDAWCSSCPAHRDPALRQVPAGEFMLPLTGSLQGSLWAIQGTGFFPPEVHQVAQFQAGCALLLNYQKRKRHMRGFPNSQPDTQRAALAGCPAPKLPALPSCSQQRCGTHVPCRGQTRDSGTGCNSPKATAMMSKMAPGTCRRHLIYMVSKHQWLLELQERLHRSCCAGASLPSLSYTTKCKKKLN